MPFLMTDTDQNWINDKDGNNRRWNQGVDEFQHTEQYDMQILILVGDKPRQ